MDLDNPALVRAASIPPALLAELDTNPNALQPQYRKMFAIQMNYLHQLLRSPTVPFSQRLQAMDLFAKASGAYTSASATPAGAGERFSLSINVTQAAPSTQLVVDVTPKNEPETTTDAR